MTLASLWQVSTLCLLVASGDISFEWVESDPDVEYGMVIDAGSSHSELFVYQFEDRVTSTNIPPQSAPLQIASSGRAAVPNPIGKLTSQEQSDALVEDLVEFAKTTLAEHVDRWDKFPIYLKATAGLRIMDKANRERIFGYLAGSFSNTSLNPFLWRTAFTIIASGEEEATFGWLAINYIWDKLHDLDDSSDSTLGSLDMGGQSAEIAFAPHPNSDILADFTGVRLWQRSHRLYTHSYLHYGVDAIDQRLAQLAYDESMNQSSSVVNSSCLNTGVLVNYTVMDAAQQSVNVSIVGNSQDDPYECQNMIMKLLANDTECFVEDCSFNGVYQAAIPDNMTFIAFSAYGFVVNGLNLSEHIDLGPFYNDVVIDICGMNATQLAASKYINPDTEKYITSYCWEGTYFFALLHHGFGFPVTDTPIIFTNSYQEDVISWTEGSILRDSNWLPYSLEFSNDDALNKAGEQWRAAAITLATVLCIVLMGLAFFVCKRRKNNKLEDYDSMAPASA